MILRRTKRNISRRKYSSIRELVFGLQDGIVSTTGAVIGIAAGTGNHQVVILSGSVIIAVEALSMAAGTYLSSKSKRQLLERLIEDERREIEELPEEETEELRQMYLDRGYCQEEIELMVRHVTRDKNLWLEEMIHKELGIGTRQLEETGVGAVVMWFAYTLGGAVPIIPFIMLDIEMAMLVAFVGALFALFAIGVWKAKVTNNSVLRSGLEMMVISAAAGLVGYLIGRIVGVLTGIDVTV
jgi:vacuolar iron transporter family protein